MWVTLYTALILLSKYNISISYIASALIHYTIPLCIVSPLPHSSGSLVELPHPFQYPYSPGLTILLATPTINILLCTI